MSLPKGYQCGAEEPDERPARTVSVDRLIHRHLTGDLRTTSHQFIEEVVADAMRNERASFAHELLSLPAMWTAEQIGRSTGYIWQAVESAVRERLKRELDDGPCGAFAELFKD